MERNQFMDRIKQIALRACTDGEFRQSHPS